ncbi:MAG: helix-turn-helix domain-containing protein [Agriterribacter sp.]
MKYFTAVFTTLNETNALTVTIALAMPDQEINGCNHKKEYLDIKNCSDFTGLSKPKLYSLVARKQIPFLRYGHRIFFIKHHLKNWLKKNNSVETA